MLGLMRKIELSGVVGRGRPMLSSWGEGARELGRTYLLIREEQ